MENQATTCFLQVVYRVLFLTLPIPLILTLFEDQYYSSRVHAAIPSKLKLENSFGFQTSQFTLILLITIASQSKDH